MTALVTTLQFEPKRRRRGQRERPAWCLRRPHPRAVVAATLPILISIERCLYQTSLLNPTQKLHTLLNCGHQLTVEARKIKHPSVRRSLCDELDPTFNTDFRRRTNVVHLHAVRR